MTIIDAGFLDPGIHDNVPSELYLADKLTPEPSLSRSGIVMLANGATMADYAASSPRLRNPEWPALKHGGTDATELGEIIHAKVLGPGSAYIVGNPSDHVAPSTSKPYSTWSGEAKKWKEEREAEGLIVIDADRNALADMIAAKLTCALIDRFGHQWVERRCEQTVIAKRRLNDGSEIWCRIRIDALLPSVIVDVKTTQLSLSDEALGVEIARKGLAVQHAFYQDVLWSAEEPGRNEAPPVFIFAYVRTVAPYTVRFVNLDDGDVAWPLGRTRADIDNAAHRFGAAVKSGEWPDAPIDAKPICPTWLQYAGDEISTEETE